MSRLKQLAGNLLFTANIFILFLLVFESRLVLPGWLQVIGRMHPLFLHFPIVLILVALIMEFLPHKESAARDWHQNLSSTLLLIGALTAAVTVVMGLFLSKEEGYSGELLGWHKWAGVVVLWLASAIYWIKQWRVVHPVLIKTGALLTAAGLIIAGHFGANLTHGSNFVLAPVTGPQTAPMVPLEQAIVYEHLVRPVLEEKCMGCHNKTKAKGELIMETPEQLLRGGKNGKLWVAGQPDVSLLLQRVHLPLEEKKHMPPTGKPQLTANEIQLLTYWIKAGADFKTMVTALPPADSLRLLANIFLQPPASTTPVYDFPEADEKTIAKLNNNYRVIYPVALHVPALVVNFYNKEAYNAKALEELLPLKQQITELHLQKMPVKDEELKTIAKFEQLRRLNLSFTQITGQQFDMLAALPYLESLTLSGAPVTLPALQRLRTSKSLKEVQVWNTPVTPAQLDQLAKEIKHIAFIKGFKDDGSTPLKLNAPVLENTALIFNNAMQLHLKHPIAGTEIRYTIDGTEPDSLHSPLFKDSVLLQQATVVKTRAFKPGWKGSEMVQFNFYKTTYIPDSIVYLGKPNKEYPGNSPKVLLDREKGDFEFASGKWQGFKDNTMQILLLFNEPKAVQDVTLSMLRNTGSYIFPPSAVEIWGGDDAHSMKLLKKATPPAATQNDPNANISVDCSFAPATVKCIKIIAKPTMRLPDWHPGKGQTGWVFVDEILVN